MFAVRSETLSWLAVVVLISACAGPPSSKVLVIGIDGVRPDVLAEVPTPNMDRLIAEGFFSSEAQTGLPTVSGPGWSSFLIGVWPEKHQVFSNDFTGHAYDEHQDFLTRIEAVRPELRTFAAADWLPLVTTDAGGPVIGDSPDKKVILDGYELGWAQADSQITDSAIAELSSGDPDALFVYLGNPDETSHADGDIGSGYRAAIADADRQVGRLMDAVRRRSTYGDEDWLVIISTDHGRRADGGHGGSSPEERTIFFLVSGASVQHDPAPSPPEIVDVAVTALIHLGIPLDPAWALDGEAVGIVEGNQ